MSEQNENTRPPMINEYKNDVEVIINNTPIIETNKKDSSKIMKITILTDIGNITWKPTIEQETFKDGFKVVDTVQMTFETLPKLLKEIAVKIQNDGKCKMKVNYTLGTVGEGKEKQEYRFITSEKTLEKWVFI